MSSSINSLIKVVEAFPLAIFSIAFEMTVWKTVSLLLKLSMNFKCPNKLS